MVLNVWPFVGNSRRAMSFINVPGAQNGTTRIIHSHVLAHLGLHSLCHAASSSCLIPYNSRLLQHTVACLACPKFLTFRPWVPKGSLLSSEHQNLALMRLHQMFCHLSSAFEALSLPRGGSGGGSNKPGVPWEGEGLLICSQEPSI